MKIRQWCLRISSENDGSCYLYSGDDVSYPDDDYLEVVEKSAYDDLNEALKLAVEALEKLTEYKIINFAPHEVSYEAPGDIAVKALAEIRKLRGE